MNLNPIWQQYGNDSQYFDFPARHSFAGLRLIAPPIKEPVSLDLAIQHCRADQHEEDAVILGYIEAARQYCEARTSFCLLPQTWRMTLSAWPAGSHIKLPLGPLLSVEAVRYFDASLVAHVLSTGVDYLVDAGGDQGRIDLPYGGSWPTEVLSPSSPIQVDFRAGLLSISALVFVAGAAVTWISGDLFDATLIGNQVNVNGQYRTVIALQSSTMLTLDAAPVVGSPGEAGSNATLIINQVPAPITQAILMMVSHWYENREAVVVGNTSTVATKMELAVDSLLRPYTIYRF